MASFILVIMSHGSKGGVYGTDGRKDGSNQIKVKWIEEQFAENCAYLKNKPKLFFVQTSPEEEQTTNHEDSAQNLIRPHDATPDVHSKADIFTMMWTVPDEKVLKDLRKGTHFIHIMCHTICEHCHHWSLIDIMTEINAKHKEIIINRNSSIVLQQPIITTTFSKDFYFLP